MERLRFLLISTALLFFTGCGGTDADGVRQALEKNIDIERLYKHDLQYNPPKDINPKHLAIIKYILQNTNELYVHRMRGEIGNKVYANVKDGKETVMNKDGKEVTNYNKGTDNHYLNISEPIKKFVYDITPWLKWGQGRDDVTSYDERLYYYLLDLNLGIQAYIFRGSKTVLDDVDFNSLSKNEQEAYYIFMHLLFNENYDVKLNYASLERLKSDSEYYARYFSQVQNLAGIDKDKIAKFKQFENA